MAKIVVSLRCAPTQLFGITPGYRPVPIRWVLIRDPAQRFDPQALLCTDLTQSHLAVVSWFLRRWQVEVCGSPKFGLRVTG
jgi:hypothetical protein